MLNLIVDDMVLEVVRGRSDDLLVDSLLLSLVVDGDLRETVETTNSERDVGD